MEPISCPALVVAAPSSGSGKTTVVAAIARHFTNLGKKVRVFKTGPDFIDPSFLAMASKEPVYQIDFWMCGEQHCKRLIWEAAQDADLILIEGVMGMFDGQCSSADIAATLGIPVLAVIDAGKMAQTFGALAHGLATYRDDIQMYGVFANYVASTGHSAMLETSLPNTLKYFGYLPKDMDMSLPERHLGLVQAQELEDIEQRLDQAASLLASHSDIQLPPPVTFEFVEQTHFEKGLKGHRIAVAKDKAFSFIYQANIELLESLGAQIEFFSPIAGDSLPACDALYLPGGYPELYLDELEQNHSLMAQIREHALGDKPILAECGGMLYLNQSLTDLNGKTVQLCSVLGGVSKMEPRLKALGLVESQLLTHSTLRGHTFHYSSTDSKEFEFNRPLSQRGKEMDPVWVKNKVVASYVHWYFPFNPELVNKIFKGELS
ncbi:cobyrinate a,c-diamide synthase [Vibrio sonorensis]|uniref:cobyrinate a,c-diamide synthase n=1 Tax=Vibrio sonorensis TaxID=1004316 RepID=UPI0008D9C27E|nr:cobyrinate a,c-diamide synthase [Vibrio sonorensis]